MRVTVRAADLTASQNGPFLMHATRYNRVLVVRRSTVRRTPKRVLPDALEMGGDSGSPRRRSALPLFIVALTPGVGLISGFLRNSVIGAAACLIASGSYLVVWWRLPRN